LKPPENIAGYNPLITAGDCRWDADAARRAVDFFSQVLTHPDDSPTTKAGDPLTLQKWQSDYVATLYGWLRPDGSRRFRESLAAIPRKNGKSTLAAGLGLYGLTAEGRTAGQVYTAAYSRDQAKLIYAMAARMVKQSKHLVKRLDCIDSTARIVYRKAGSFMRSIPAEAANTHGFKPALVLFDELHTQKTRSLYDALKTGQGATVNPLFVSITTAGFDRHSICWQVWEYARKVRDGLIPDPYFLPMIYELGENEPWDQPEVWHRVNPNLGVSISLDFLREEFSRAREQPAYENTFRNLYLNQWVEQAVRWIPMDKWRACGGEQLDVSGLECYAGLDLSTTTDITALVLAFRLPDGRVYLVPHFWIPRENARVRERRDRVPYVLWGTQEHLTMTDGDVVDYDVVRRDINALRERYNIREIAIDRWNAAQITTQLQGDGFEIVPHGQGYASMSAPAKEFEKLVFGSQLVHPNNPVLNWMASNVAVEQDAAGNLKPSKKVSTERIDGIVAAVMAVGRLALEQGQQWFYQSNGVEIG
jgi:phage terminase large subunit-like protein